MSYASFDKHRMHAFWIITGVFVMILAGTYLAKPLVSFSFITDKVSQKSVAHYMAHANLAIEAFSYRMRMNGYPGNIVQAVASVAKTGKLDPGAPDAGGPVVAEADTATNAIAVPVILYHGILTNPDGVNITANTLWDQLFALKQAGYYTITLQQFEDYLNGKIILPGRPFLLTFDDGRNDSFYNGDPILHALGYNAVMFDISGRIDKSNFSLSSADLKSMQESGRWDIESHTRNGHDASYPIGPDGEGGDYYSNRLWLASEDRLETPVEYSTRVRTDVVGVKTDLETLLGKPVTAFAYPFGDFGQETKNFPDATNALLGIMGNYYDVTFFQAQSDQGPIYNYPISAFKQPTNPVLARRIEPKYNWNGAELVTYMTSMAPKTLPFTDTFKDNQGWVISWGTSRQENGTRILSATASSTGSSVILQGSHGWKDYRMDASVDWSPSQSISLLARFADEKNNADCNFSVGGVRIRETINGVEKEVIETKLPVPMTKNSADLGISVVGNTVRCYLNDKVVTSATYANSNAPKGGVAISVWSPALGVAGATLRDVSVVPL